MHAPASDNAARRQWMGLLAKSPAVLVTRLCTRLCKELSGLPAWDYLRRPEIGLVMVRGRMGGDGAPFNLGEMTVTRCSVRLESGLVGHAWVAGRSADHACSAALADALLQDPRWHPAVTKAVVAPLRDGLRDARDQASRKAAATRVDFFTLVRAED